VPVGTPPARSAILRKSRPEGAFDRGPNRSSARGLAIGDLMRPTRVVIGAEDRGRERGERCAHRALLIESRSCSTAIRDAELIKYAANSFLATKISVINELAEALEKGDGTSRTRGERHRPRRPHRHEVPADGPGYGGSAFQG